MVKSISTNQIFKIFNYQTESNKFYSIIANSNFDKEQGVKLNPYYKPENFLDNEIIVIREKDINELPSFNIINTDIGLLLEVYSLSRNDVYIVDNIFELDDLINLIGKFSSYNFNSTIKFLKMKYGFKEMHLISYP